MINKIFFFIKRKIFENFIFKFSNKKTVFEKIYKYNYWGSKESVSGPGSDKKRAKNLIRCLPVLIKKYKIKTVFDAPCGDLNWIKNILNKNIIHQYLGGDIVNDLIIQNKLYKFRTKSKFILFNILKDHFPKTDLWICRDILYHFNFKDIFETLNNFTKSDIKYVLMSNCLVDKNHINKDIPTGHYRDLCFYKYPFNFDIKPLEKIKDVKFKLYKEEMCLWSRLQIRDFLKKI